MHSPLPPYLLAFQSELRKLAWGPEAAARLRGAGAAGGLGALLGAGGGALAGGTSAYRSAREQGETRTHAGLAALRSGMGGAVSGGVLGGLLGAGAGAASKRLGGGVADALTEARGPVGAFVRAGQRQVHGLTGWTPEGGLEAIRGGAYDAKRSLREASGIATSLRDAEQQLARGQTSVSALPPQVQAALRGQKGGRDELRAALQPHIEKADKAVLSAQEHASAVQHAQDAGLTNLPGIARGFARDPMQTLKDTVNTQWAGASRGQRAMLVGMGALNAAGAVNAARSDDPDHGGQAGQAAGNLAGSLLLSPVMPMGASMAASSALAAGGQRVGRLFNRVPHPAEAPPAPPVEHDRAPRAEGV